MSIVIPVPPCPNCGGYMSFIDDHLGECVECHQRFEFSLYGGGGFRENILATDGRKSFIVLSDIATPTKDE